MNYDSIIVGGGPAAVSAALTLRARNKTVAIISGERENVTKSIEYFIEKNVGVEVLKDARYSA